MFSVVDDEKFSFCDLEFLPLANEIFWRSGVVTREKVSVVQVLEESVASSTPSGA